MTWQHMIEQLSEVTAALVDPGEIDSDGRERELAKAVFHLRHAIKILEGAQGGSP